jgi:hypothetical protein
MPGELLNGPCGRPTHRHVRTERVPKNVNARPDVRSSRRPAHHHLSAVRLSPSRSDSRVTTKGEMNVGTSAKEMAGLGSYGCVRVCRRVSGDV